MGALNIKDKDVAAMAQELAKLNGTTITAAVSAALEESLRVARRRKKIDREARERRVDEIIARFNADTPPDAPSWKEIMDDMYDENGLPK